MSAGASPSYFVESEYAEAEIQSCLTQVGDLSMFEWTITTTTNDDIVQNKPHDSSS
jgi:hypothetical protein